MSNPLKVSARLGSRRVAAGSGAVEPDSERTGGDAREIGVVFGATKLSGMAEPNDVYITGNNSNKLVSEIQIKNIKSHQKNN